MPPSEVEPAPPPRWQRNAVLALASGYVLVGIAMMLWASPKVPYADSYRFLATFLELPFPQNALAADNGHREVLTNLLRIAELHWLHANQWLQILVGTTGVLLGAALLAGGWWRETNDRWLAAFALVAGCVFWLGNARKLAHGSECAHLGPILVCLALGLRLLHDLPRDGGARRVWLAALLGVVATLSFGSGIATFVAFAIPLLLQRASARHWLPLVCGWACGALLLLAGGGGASATIEFAPLAQLDLWLRWLGAPFVWMLSPLLDPAHAERLPLLSGPATAIARTVHELSGPMMTARWPAFAFGLFGITALGLYTARHWRRGGPATERLALSVAWFGATVGGLVVLLRADYFAAHPDQLVSIRYVPWSMLLWLGVLLTVAHRPTRSPRVRLGIALAALLALAPSQFWTGRWALRLQETANVTALGAAVGVLDEGYDLVETFPDDLRRAIPLLRAADAAMFAWPQTGLLGTVPAPGTVLEVACRDVSVEPVDNLFDGAGAAVTFGWDGSRSQRLLLLDERGVVCGLAIADRDAPRWRGFVRGAPSAETLRAAAQR